MQHQAGIFPGDIGVLKIAMLESVCGPSQAHAIEFGSLKSLIDEGWSSACPQSAQRPPLQFQG